MRAAAAALLLLACAAAAQPRGRRDPPPQAYEACSALEEDDACSFETPHGAEPGTCARFEQGMACIPEGAPKPPPVQRRRQEPAEDAGGIEAPARPAARARTPAFSGPPAMLAPLPPMNSPPIAPVEAAVTAAPPVATSAAPPAAPAQPAPEPSPDAFPLELLLAGIGAFAGLLALARVMLAPVTAPVAAAPAPAAPSPAPAPAPVPETARTAPEPRGPGGGMLVGRDYELVRELGRGGMGVVYEARDLRLERRVALKKMKAEVAANPRERERFLAEAKLVAALNHPNIVAIHNIVEDGAELYLVFEYVEGDTLDALLGRLKRLPPASVLTLLADVAAAVDHAHEQRVIHRDLKPANIMVDRAGRAKVMDFGIAHQAKLTVSRLTMAAPFGTLAYMPPEQELGQAVRQSDVYALAAVAYEALTGALPFPGPDFHAQKAAKAFPRPSAVLPSLSARLDPVFERAFETEPTARHATSRELLVSLRAAFG